ncbi:tRNA epoxyqueuosine(34) reductase QueG [Rubritalea tangerina]|uniref:tRNA epoxyqueuosine(34) reductase QueG n=2 Tax=Rubritalea tangerina TaxID=430798 RepID=A0ABW4ZCS9_9BACT
MEFTAEIIKRNIQFITSELGFSDCRIASVRRASHADRYLDWVKQGCAGEMAWMERNTDRRVHPAAILPGAKSVISLALNYFPGHQAQNDDYKIARYAWNDDYHDIIEDKLKDLDLALADMGGTQRYYVDTGPVLERDFANDAGLGWNGKSTVQIHKDFGTWFFLCELITTLDLEADPSFGDHCGKCTRCIDHCPTQAITGPREMDARRCISYLTIEYGGSIPTELRPLMGNRIYGCDVCLEVCPWNRFAKISRETKLHARKEIFDHSLRDFLRMDPDSFRKTFAKSPIKRIKHNRFIRNVCVALGNTGSLEHLPLLREQAAHADPLIAEHAQWAIDQISSRA